MTKNTTRFLDMYSMLHICKVVPDYQKLVQPIRTLHA